MKLHLKNIGKIDTAEMEIKPLTIFIGKNGSGKTYAASTLWSIMIYIRNSFPDNLLSSKIFDEYKEKIKPFLIKMLNNESTQFVITKEELIALQKIVNQHIQKNTPTILSEVFGSDVFFRQSIVSIEYTHTEDYKLSFQSLLELNLGKDVGLIKIMSSFGNNKMMPASTYFDLLGGNAKDKELVYASMAELFLQDLPMVAVFGKEISFFNKTYYIPAARTGLMLGINELVQDKYERSIYAGFRFPDDKSNKKNLPLTLQSFVSEINSPVRKALANVSSPSFPTSLLDGRIKPDADHLRYEFAPTGVDTNIPLAISSSLVTELAALAILYPTAEWGDCFIILEEPEAHLHLSAQREMAKIVAFLINRGCRILLTSHSDTFLQQLNNLILLHKLNDKSLCEDLKVDFDTQTLNADDIAFYDFDMQDGKTIVKPIACGKYGFVAESINRELIRLSKESYLIQNKVDDLDSPQEES